MNMRDRRPSYYAADSVMDDPLGSPFGGTDPVSTGRMWHGILLPALTASFRNDSLERSYLTYSHRQRQKSLIIVNVVDLVLKMLLAIAYVWRTRPAPDVSASQLTWTICFSAMNLGISVLGMWRCFANNYLAWAGMLTWLLLNVQGLLNLALGFTSMMVWYMLFVIFVPYAMLPLSLKWCIACGFISATLQLVRTYVQLIRSYATYVPANQEVVANVLVNVAVNVAGLYTKYMTDRGQRMAFIETHKAMENKRDSEKEYVRTQKLLDSSEQTFGTSICSLYTFIPVSVSVLPMFVNNDIRKEMEKDAFISLESQFKRLFIYHMDLVSILFADIKVSAPRTRCA